MKGPKLSGQEGMSLLEVTMAVVLMAVITAFIATQVSQSSKDANDAMAKSALGELSGAIQVCKSVHSATSADTVDNESLSQNTVACVSSDGSTTERSRLPRGVQGDVDNGMDYRNTSGWIASRSIEDGSRSPDGLLRTFCLNRHDGREGTIETDPNIALDAAQCSSL